MNKWNKITIVLIICAVAVACSTEKNSFINRNYHSLNAHYNGYFNANELINSSMGAYRNSRAEDYYKLLPLDPVPNQEEVLGLYPAIDTAISKCKKVIRDHSMPSNDRPSRKDKEHNRWIDENWITIGIASYYRRDYDNAMKSFMFVRKFYKNDPSLYTGELWMAKTHIAMGEYTKAKFNLDNLNKAIEAEKSTTKKEQKDVKKEDRIARFPKEILYELEKTKAALAFVRENKEDAIVYLENAVKYARYKDRKDVVRVHFILGQLYEEQGEAIKAKKHYTSVVKSGAPYDMRFNARLRRTFAGGANVRKELLKMLKDAKNAAYKDQIYYALAKIELKNGNKQQGKHYLTESAFYSVNNARQKGMAYELLGDLDFRDRNYVSAQKYYDSCVAVIPENYPNGETIRNKARKLADLVVAVETSYYEDSVQHVAAMPEKERVKFIKEVIKKLERDEQLRKEREAQRLLELQKNQKIFATTGDGGKGYWNNEKARTEGYEEFKRQWGVRENEDDWRRSDKTTVGFGTLGEDIVEDTTITEEKDTLTVEHLTRLLPLSDSALTASNKRLLRAYYNAGFIYKNQLNEPKFAEEQLTKVLEKKIEDPHNLLAAYELYGMFQATDPGRAMEYKNYIIGNYPDSDYASYLKDPDYFIKMKEREALSEQEYLQVLNRYNKGLYYPVIAKADQVIAGEKNNKFRAKYILLKAMCLGKTEEKNDSLIPVLELILSEYPGTEEAARAQEMLDIIKNGYSENIEADFGSKSPFTYDDRASVTVMIFLEADMSTASAKARVTDFHREFFSRERLKISSKVYNDAGLLLVKEFESEMEASRYISIYKQTRKYLLDLQNAKIMMITTENLKVLLQKQNLPQYEDFHDEYY